MDAERVLITGGAGFLGSHLCDHYAKSHKVVCVDNLSTGSRVNIQHLLDNPSFVFIEADIVQPLPVSITDEKYSIVINLASPASPPQYQRLAIETLMAGSIGLHHVLELAKRDNARFFQASTSEVYGDPLIHPQPESYNGSVNCYGPRAMYDESKRFAEAMIYVYHDKYDVNTCIARFFNTYGPRMDRADGRVVSNFIVQAMTCEDLTIYGLGEQTRSFCFVDDLVDGIVRLIDSSEHNPINLGNPEEFTMKMLAQIILELTNSKSNLKYMPLPQDDPTQRKPLINLASARLGWKPVTPLKTGLIQTIEYFRETLSAKG